MDENEPWVFLPKKHTFDDAPPRTAWDVIRLWEVRRLRYNLLLLALFAIGWIVMTILSAVVLGGGDLLSLPMMGLIVGSGCLYFLLLANLVFTVGSVSELLIRVVLRRRVDGYGPIAFKVLLAVSIAAVPVLLIWHFLMTGSAMFN